MLGETSLEVLSISVLCSRKFYVSLRDETILDETEKHKAAAQRWDPDRDLEDTWGAEPAPQRRELQLPTNSSEPGPLSSLFQRQSTQLSTSP